MTFLSKTLHTISEYNSTPLSFRQWHSGSQSYRHKTKLCLSFLTFEFLHSPPIITVDHPDNISNAGLLEILVEMNDADGIDAVCMADYYQDGNVIYSVPASGVMDLDDSGFWSNSRLLPTNISGDISFELFVKTGVVIK